MAFRWPSDEEASLSEAGLGGAPRHRGWSRKHVPGQANITGSTGGRVAEVLAKYTPQAVCVPPGVGVERSFAGYEIGDDVRALCDRTTVFCDVFQVPNRDEVVCIGPPFSDFGHPHTVRLLGRRRRFVVEELPWGPGRVSILRIIGTSDVDSADDPNVDLQVDFPEFGIDAQVRLPRGVPRPHVALTLATVQKDNDLQWLDDWCAWHQRMHGVDRFVIYDNASADRDAVYAQLARRVEGPEFVVVHWDYLYGPPLPHELNFTQPVALNHCRLLFGPYTQWCINLDVDEYLFNSGSKPLASYLRQMRKPHVYLPSYIVPMTVDNSPRRSFDSPFRSARFEGRKYVYGPAATAFAEVHDVVSRKQWSLRWIRVAAKRVLRGFGVDPGRFLAAVRRIAAWLTPRPPGRPGQSGARQGDANGSDEPTLFFFHFRALNTGWKHPRRVVPVDPDKHVKDERISAMRAIVDRR